MKAIIFKVLSRGLLILFLLALFALYHYRVVLFPQWFATTPASDTADVSTDTHVGATEKQPNTDIAPNGGAGPGSAVKSGAKPQMEPAALGTPDMIHDNDSAPAATRAIDANESPLGSSKDSVTPPAGNRPMEHAVTPPPVVEEVASPTSAQADAAVQYRSQADKPTTMGAPAGFLPPGVDDAQAGDQVQSANTVPGPALPAVTKKATVAVKTEPVSPPNAALLDSETPVVTSQPDDINLLLKQARDAYWQGNYAKARLAYQKVIALADDSDPAPYGELGNVYFAQKDLAAAAEAYSEAAYRLLAQGRVDEASHLLLVLKDLDEDKALELQHLIEQYQAQK